MNTIQQWTLISAIFCASVLKGMDTPKHSKEWIDDQSISLSDKEYQERIYSNIEDLLDDKTSTPPLLSPLCNLQQPTSITLLEQENKELTQQLKNMALQLYDVTRQLKKTEHALFDVQITHERLVEQFDRLCESTLTRSPNSSLQDLKEQIVASTLHDNKVEQDEPMPQKKADPLSYSPSKYNHRKKIKRYIKQ